MKQIIKDVLDDMANGQVNLASDAARKNISRLISAALKTKGCYTEYGDDEIEEQKARATWVCSICGENTADVDYDYLGSGTNHLGCEMKSHEGHDMGGSYESTDTMTGHDHGKVWPGTDAIQKQIYNEMTSDGLPVGGDAQAVLESHKLADEIVDNQEGKWIYESPDGGKTVFRRPFSDYDPKNKEEIDFKTKEPTGRKFTEYNNGNWSNEDEG
jgi:hypothetical protein|tara:strand:+ start:159 stop:800 length:642 start_codon:yes stop_codon:yes gene_type:complete